MGQTSRISFGLIAAIALTWASSGYALAQDATAGEKIYKKFCIACHALPGAGRNGIGPNLKSIVGRPAGTVDGFIGYSSALKEAGITWTEDKLDAWLNSPHDLVPSTRMIFMGLKSATDRANLIAFLKSN